MVYLVKIIFPVRGRRSEDGRQETLSKRFATLEEANEAGWREAKRFMDEGVNALYRLVDEDEHPVDRPENQGS